MRCLLHTFKHPALGIALAVFAIEANSYRGEQRTMADEVKAGLSRDGKLKGVWRDNRIESTHVGKATIRDRSASNDRVE